MTRPASYVAYSKDAEREVARIMGARRLHAGEYDGPGDVDVDGGWFKVQVKNRRIPAWILDGYDQIHAATVGAPEQLGPQRLVVLVDKPGPGKPRRIFVLQEIDEWVAWNGTGQ